MNTVVFIDLEATGLHAGSVPVEIGLARLNLDTLAVSSWSRLVRSRQLHDPNWDPAAIVTTDIGPELVEADGLPAADVVSEMRQWLGHDRVVVSDAPSLDARWLNALLVAAVEEGGEQFEIQIAWPSHLRQVLPSAVVDLVPGILRQHDRPHRAAGDAARFARAVAEAIVMNAGPEFLDAERFSARSRRRLSGAALRTFMRIAGRWQLSEAERFRILGTADRSFYDAWSNRALSGEGLELPADTLLRISAVLGIYKALQILFDMEAEGVAWLNDPHDAPAFGGNPPVALMTSGTLDGLMLVRRYLAGMRGGVFAAPNAADRDFTPLTDEDIEFVC